MTIKEAMKERHMVRKYVDKEIPEDVVLKLNERIEQNNDKYNLSIKLMLNNDKAVNSIIKLLLAKGVKNYIILAGNESDDLAELLGYSSADIMLYAQTLGLNTWYVGGTFNRGVSKYVPNKKVIGIVAIGYGVNNGVPHKSKTIEEVSCYDGNMPNWFKEGIEASLLAPTALNKQDYKIIGKGNNVKIEIDNGIFTGANNGDTNISLPLSALYQVENKTQVWIVNDASCVELKDINVISLGKNDVIVSGLNKGDVVVTAGVHKLYEGQSVKLADGDTL